MTSPKLDPRSALLTSTAVAVSSSFSGTSAGRQLSVNPAPLNFGEVVVGTTETLSVKVVNLGSASITVSSIASSQASYTVKYPTVPVTLSPSQSLVIQVTFKPGAIGFAPGEIAINGGTAYLKVSGTGQSSKTLQATPASIVFGSVPGGSSATSNVAITNGRNTSVTITTADTTGSGFSVEGLSLPLTLTPGQSFTFKFEPGAGADSLMLTKKLNLLAPPLAKSLPQAN